MFCACSLCSCPICRRASCSCAAGALLPPPSAYCSGRESEHQHERHEQQHEHHSHLRLREEVIGRQIAADQAVAALFQRDAPAAPRPHFVEERAHGGPLVVCDTSRQPLSRRRRREALSEQAQKEDHLPRVECARPTHFPQSTHPIQLPSPRNAQAFCVDRCVLQQGQQQSWGYTYGIHTHAAGGSLCRSYRWS